MNLTLDSYQDLNQSYRDLQDLDFSDYYNESWEGPCVQTQNQSLGLVLGPYVHSVICVLGLLGNSLVVLTYCCLPRPGSVTQVLLLHLALADLLLVLVLPGLVVSELWPWSLGGVGCKLLRGGYSVSLYSATLLLAAVSVDRYAAVVHARRRVRPRAPGLNRAICAAVWLSAAALSLPDLIFYDLYVPEHSQVVLWVQDWDQDSGDQAPPPSDPVPPSFVCDLQFPDRQTARLMKVLVPVLQLCAGFLVPLVLMWFCYGSILVTLLRGRSLRRHRAVWLVLAVALVFALCHVPYNAVLLWSTVVQFQIQDCEDWDRLHSALSLTQTLAYLHCVLNPLLYGFTSATFRNHFCRVMEKLCCKLRPQRRLSSTSQSERSTAYTL